jgi:hypothetical protein
MKTTITLLVLVLAVIAFGWYSANQWYDTQKVTADLRTRAMFEVPVPPDGHMVATVTHDGDWLIAYRSILESELKSSVEIRNLFRSILFLLGLLCVITACVSIYRLKSSSTQPA